MQDKLKDGGIQSREIIGTEPIPTTLHLFRIKNGDKRLIEDQFNAAILLDRQNCRAHDAQTKLADKSRDKIARLVETKKTLPEEIYLTKSSQVAGVMYLRLYEELYERRGLSAEEFMQFYNLTLHVSTTFWDPYINTLLTKGVQAAKLRETAMGSAPIANLIMNEARKNYGNDIPWWFQGSMDDWKTFLVYHAASHYYLDPEAADNKYPAHTQPPKSPMPEWFDAKSGRYILSDGIPDWATSGRTTLVPKEIVEAELAQDTVDLAELHKKRINTDSQIDYFVNLINQNGAKLISRFTKELRRQFPQTPNTPPETFSDVILYLAAINGNQIITINPDQLPAEDPVLLRKCLVDFSDHLQYISQEFSNRNFTPEGIALFLEKKLVEAGIISSVSEPTGDKLTLLFQLVNGEITEEETYQLRGEDKKKFAVLYYDLKPLLSILPGNAHQYLSELNVLSSQEAIETVIWEIADALSGQLKPNHSVNPKASTPFEKSLLELTKFTQKWLRNNWHWAVMELYRTLDSINGNESTDQTTTPAAQQTGNPDTVALSLEETQETSKQVEAGNLQGWKIYYTDNKSLDPQHLTEIQGESMQEKADSLKQYVLERGIVCPIKPENVIGSLDQIAGSPDSYEEWVRMRKSVNGHEFKKIKKARSGRIFYIMDQAKKTITFFVYKKEAWEYKF